MTYFWTVAATIMSLIGSVGGFIGSMLKLLMLV